MAPEKEAPPPWLVYTERKKKNKCLRLLELPLKIIVSLLRFPIGLVTTIFWAVCIYFSLFIWHICKLVGFRFEIGDFPLVRLSERIWFWCNFVYLSIEVADDEANVKKLSLHQLMRESPFIIANHISYLDPVLAITYLEHPVCMSKKSVLKLPAIGPYSKAMNFILVDRASKESRGAALQAMKDKASEWVKGVSRPTFLFPEGTVFNGEMLAPFKVGAFVAGQPVRPVLFCYHGSWNPSNCHYMRVNSKDSSSSNEVEMAEKVTVATSNLSENDAKPLLKDDSNALTQRKNAEGSTSPVKASSNPRDQDKYLSDTIKKRSITHWLKGFVTAFYIPVRLRFLPVYNPNEEEKKDPELFAENVRQHMQKEYSKMQRELGMEQ